MLAGMVLPRDIDDAAVLARRAIDEGVQQHLDASLGAQRVEHTLHRLGFEHHEHAAMALRPSAGAEPAQALHHLLGDAGDRLARRIAQRVEAAVGDDVAQGRGTAQAARPLDQQGARPAADGGDGGRDTRAATADDGDVVGGHGSRTSVRKTTGIISSAARDLSWCPKGPSLRSG
ncbi:MAG TPA: hypothetical protein VLA02_12055 [Reyranella sp.]|nr:hypothetical protein [Reyranella sp.]